MAHLLEVEGLETTFRSDFGAGAAIDHVSFTVDAGETVCIVGESGCGKSVTSLSLLGLLPRNGRVTAGRALFEGRDLLAMTEKELDEVRGAGIVALTAALLLLPVLLAVAPASAAGGMPPCAADHNNATM